MPGTTPHTFTPAQKKRIVAFADKHTVKDAAAKYRVTESTIYAWRKNGNGHAAPPLPTTSAKAAKPRALRPTLFACPHCGAPVTVPQ
jgi:transposase-like protein